MRRSPDEKRQDSISDEAVPALEQSASASRKADRKDCPEHESSDTGIVIVNWNSWGETIEALEAVFRMLDFDGPVIVCDNASGDGSLANIQLWAQGGLCAVPENRAPEIASLVIPPVKKEFTATSLACDEVDACELSSDTTSTRLWIVACAENRGFAAGCNVGIRLLQRMPNIRNFWLLNCDALPARQAYLELKRGLPTERLPVVCGSALLEYWDPTTIQSCGAKFNSRFCSMSDNFKGMPVEKLNDLGGVYRVDYPVGASILVNREFLDLVGLMCEKYFLYFEELDWVMRFGWPSRAFIITSSRIYHKGGSTTGAGLSIKERGLKADYYFLRSRVLFARRFAWRGWVAASIVAIVRRMIAGRPGAVRNAIAAIRAGFRL